MKATPPRRANAVIMALGLAMILLAAGLRLHNIGAQSFWNDEGSSYVQATRSFAGIASNAARDIHPPGYYWLLALWRLLVGETEFALRALSTFASIISIAFTFALGSKRISPIAGLTAALFVALNTFSIYYAQEARMYALLALWGTAGIWALLSLVTISPSGSSLKPYRRWGLALALINAAGLYTQYAYPFIMLAQGVIFLVAIALHYRKSHRVAYTPLLAYIAANLLTILLYLPWLPTALHQITTWPSTGTPIPTGEALTIISGWFTFGITYTNIENAVSFLPLALLILTIGLAGLLWHSRSRAVLPVFSIIIWSLLPVALFLLLGLFRPANLKFLLPSQIGFALLIGTGIAGWWSLARRRSHGNRLSLILILLLTAWLVAYSINGLPPLYNDPHFQRSDYRAIVAHITQDPRPKDAIILDAPNQEEVFRYYYRDDAPVYPLPPGLGGNDAETQTLVRDIIRQHDRIFVLFWGETERDPNRIVETTLDQEAFEAGQDTWYGEVRLARYVTPAPMGQSTLAHARFNNSIFLERYAVSARSLAPGDVLQIRLEWMTEAPLDKRYKVFVQLLNSGGVLVAQRDAEPAGNSRPTTSWTPDEIIIDPHGLSLPSELSPGMYQVIVGLYDIDDPGQRLLVRGRTYFLIAQVHVR
ncbi:MAG: glycosyltransferase family 39 protein [Anaerolineae bacterium]|nr:glycosyltransferase family 39 protein [Anaerolineae bacterium]